jgi:hypothetical protein
VTTQLNPSMLKVSGPEKKLCALATSRTSSVASPQPIPVAMIRVARLSLAAPNDTSEH